MICWTCFMGEKATPLNGCPPNKVSGTMHAVC